MPIQYMDMVNEVLASLNEVPLTQTTFPDALGPQLEAKNAVSASVEDILNQERNWPFCLQTQSQTLTPGVQTYALPSGYRIIDWRSFYLYTPDLVTNGNFTTDISGWTNQSAGTGTATWSAGLARLNGGTSGTGAVEQQLATVNGILYRVFVRLQSGSVNLTIGTTSGAGDLYSGALTFTNIGGGQFFEVQFTAPGATAFIRFSNSSNSNSDVDSVSVFDQTPPIPLRYMEYDQWRYEFRQNEMRMTPTSYSRPTFVFANNADQFGVSTIPDKPYIVQYDYWIGANAPTLYNDVLVIPDRYRNVIHDGAMYNMYMFRDNQEQAAVKDRAFEAGVERMRSDLINKNRNMLARAMPTRYKGWAV